MGRRRATACKPQTGWLRRGCTQAQSCLCQCNYPDVHPLLVEILAGRVADTPAPPFIAGGKYQMEMQFHVCGFLAYRSALKTKPLKPSCVFAFHLYAHVAHILCQCMILPNAVTVTSLVYPALIESPCFQQQLGPQPVSWRNRQTRSARVEEIVQVSANPGSVSMFVGTKGLSRRS